MPINGEINANIECGYKPFLTIPAFGQLTIKFEKMNTINNHICFERNLARTLPISTSACSFTDIWREIINNNDIDYNYDYITYIGNVFKDLTAAKKSEIQQLFYAQSYIYNNNGSFYGEVWNRFVKKLEPLTKLYSGTSSDEAVWYQMINTVYCLISKNIFY